jgi:hypothetical protein
MYRGGEKNIPVDVNGFQYLPLPAETFQRHPLESPDLEVSERYIGHQEGYTTAGKPLRNAWPELMQKCWALNPEERPTFASIVGELKEMRMDLMALA